MRIKKILVGAVAAGALLGGSASAVGAITSAATAAVPAAAAHAHHVLADGTTPDMKFHG